MNYNSSDIRVAW